MSGDMFKGFGERRVYKNWTFPLYAEVLFLGFFSPPIGEGGYFRTGIRATRNLSRIEGEWGFDDFHRFDSGYGISVGVGHSREFWKTIKLSIEGTIDVKDNIFFDYTPYRLNIGLRRWM